MGIIFAIAGLILIGIFGNNFIEKNKYKYYDIPADEEDKHPIIRHFYNNDSLYKSIFIGLVICGLVVLAAIGIIVVVEHCGADAIAAESAAVYDSLIYKMESTTCRDEFGFLNKEVIDEVAEWNRDLAKYKSLQRDPWIGCFTPNIFDEFEFIDYTSFTPNVEGVS